MALKFNLNRKPKKQRFIGLTVLSLGLIILGYLLYIKISFSSANNLKEPSQTVSFAKVLGTTKEADPGLKASPEQLSSFGSILGLKSKTDQKSTVFPSFTLTIPKLNIENALVKTNVNGISKESYLPVLKNAVAHFERTALPGEIGNVFLFGHSMLPILAHGQYESIFTNLPKLKKNDRITLNYGGKIFNYIIEETGVVDPKDVFVLAQSQTEQKITLMTCIPPGFGEKRFIVIGKLIKNN